MKFRKLNDEVELPEKTSSGYINLRSAERVDVRPGETRNITTGVEAKLDKSESYSFEPDFTSMGNSEVTTISPNSYTELALSVTNPYDTNIMIYPGQVLGRFHTWKTAKLNSAATFVEE